MGTLSQRTADLAAPVVIAFAALVIAGALGVFRAMVAALVGVLICWLVGVAVDVSRKRKRRG